VNLSCHHDPLPCKNSLHIENGFHYQYIDPQLFCQGKMLKKGGNFAGL